MSGPLDPAEPEPDRAPAEPPGPDVDGADRGGPEPAPEPASGPEPGPDRLQRARRAAVDTGVGYGLALGRAALRAGIGLGRAGAEVARQAVDASPLGDAAGAVADRLEPHAERGRRQRAATAAEVDAVIGRVTDEVVRRLDVDGIVGQVDVDAIVRRVDVDEVVQRVDIDDIIQRVDVDGIVSRTEVGTLIVQSTGGIATSLLDFVRSIGVSVDRVVTLAVDRVLRGGRPRPVAPPLLEGVTDVAEIDHVDDPDRSLPVASRAGP